MTFLDLLGFSLFVDLLLLFETGLSVEFLGLGFFSIIFWSSFAIDMLSESSSIGLPLIMAFLGNLRLMGCSIQMELGLSS